MAKTIFITGASSGIGKATAELFHHNGWNVVATMRSPEKEEQLTKLDHVLVTRLDVQNPESIANAVAAGIARFGGIDVLVNNAGYGAYGPLEATPVQNIRRQFDVNVIGLMETTKALLPHFRSKKSGVIINISSVGGRITFPLGSLYHGSKFAVEGLSEALSYEMEAIGVRVKIVEPGIIKTDFNGRSFDFNNDEGLVEYQETVAKLFSALTPDVEAGAAPTVVAEVIYEAATDGSARLRYTAGEDAKAIIDNRKKLDDAAFMQGIRDRIGI